MDFLHPGLLPFFLPLVALPLLLHLLTLRRLKTVELSTFRFLFDSYVHQRRRMKFFEALIAALRVLFLLFVILAVARPVWKEWGRLFRPSRGAREVVLLIDISASMAAVTNGVSSLDRAKRTALEVIHRLDADDHVAVYGVANRAVEVCNRFASDRETIGREIDRLSATASRANFFAALQELFGASSAGPLRPTLYVFTDLQENAWREFGEDVDAPDVLAGTQMVLVDVGSQQDQANRSVTSDGPADPRVIVGLPVTLCARVANRTSMESRNLSVKLLVDEKEVARTQLALKPGEEGDAELIFTPKRGGILYGRFEIPADRFSHDDSFLFTLNASPRVRVLLVNGRPSVEPLDDEGLYLRTALVSTEVDPLRGGDVTRAGDDASGEVTRTLRAVLDVRDIAESQVSEDALSGVDVVILANCGNLQVPEQFDLLDEFVARGGGMLIFPGDRVRRDLYNEHLFAGPGIPDEQLVAARFEAVAGNPDDANTAAQLGAVDFAHPVFSVFADDQRRYLTKVRVYRRFEIGWLKEPGNSWSLAQFAGGVPAVIESRYGAGRVILCAFPANARWSNIPMRPEFVPLVLKMLTQVRRRSDLEGPSVVPPDGVAEFTVAPSWAPVSAELRDVRSRATPVPFKRSNRRLVGAYDRTSDKGFYTIEVRGGDSDHYQRDELSFAVNVAPQESDFSKCATADIASRLPGVQVSTVDASAEAQQWRGFVGNQREIWRPLILLTLVLVGIEFVLCTSGGSILGNEQNRSLWQRLRDLARGTWVKQMTGSELESESNG